MTYKSKDLAVILEEWQARMQKQNWWFKKSNKEKKLSRHVGRLARNLPTQQLEKPLKKNIHLTCTFTNYTHCTSNIDIYIHMQYMYVYVHIVQVLNHTHCTFAS